MTPVFQYTSRDEPIDLGPLVLWLFDRLSEARTATAGPTGPADTDGPEARDWEEPDDEPWLRPEGPHGELELDPEEDERGDPADCGETSPGWRLADLASVDPALEGLARSVLRRLTRVPPDGSGGAPWARWSAALREVTHWEYGVDLCVSVDFRVVAPVSAEDGRPMWAVVVEGSVPEGCLLGPGDPLTVSVFDLHRVDPENEGFIDLLARSRIWPPLART